MRVDLIGDWPGQADDRFGFRDHLAETGNRRRIGANSRRCQPDFWLGPGRTAGQGEAHKSRDLLRPVRTATHSGLRERHVCGAYDFPI